LCWCCVSETFLFSFFQVNFLPLLIFSLSLSLFFLTQPTIIGSSQDSIVHLRDCGYGSYFRHEMEQKEARGSRYHQGQIRQHQEKGNIIHIRNNNSKTYKHLLYVLGGSFFQNTMQENNIHSSSMNIYIYVLTYNPLIITPKDHFHSPWRVALE
jgi:hypothetical protein